jgi:hypothetical protein
VASRRVCAQPGAQARARSACARFPPRFWPILAAPRLAQAPERLSWPARVQRGGGRVGLTSVGVAAASLLGVGGVARRHVGALQPVPRLEENGAPPRLASPPPAPRAGGACLPVLCRPAFSFCPTPLPSHITCASALPRSPRPASRSAITHPEPPLRGVPASFSCTGRAFSARRNISAP